MRRLVAYQFDSIGTIVAFTISIVVIEGQRQVVVIYDVSAGSDGEHVGNMICFAMALDFAVLWYILTTVDWQFGQRNVSVLHQNLLLLWTSRFAMVPHLDDTTAV